MLTAEPVVFGEADLTNCDREPIHIPGSIQPYGVLLIIDRQDLSIEQTAGDTKLMVGIEPERLIGRRLSSLLDGDTLAFVVAQLDTPAVRVAPVLRLGVVSRGAAIPQDLTLSAQGRTVLVELEPARRASSSAGDPIAQHRPRAWYVRAACQPHQINVEGASVCACRDLDRRGLLRSGRSRAARRHGFRSRNGLPVRV